MLNRAVLGMAAVLVFASWASAQTGPAGHWEGTATVEGGRQLVLSVDLRKNEKSEWVASMGAPAANATGLVVQDITVNGNAVTFTGVELMMAKFDLTLGPDGRMKGTITNAQMSAPIEFTRTGEAKVDLIPPSPAVSKELEGDWEGVMEVPGHPLRIALHFRNQPDHTVAATFTNLDMGAGSVPLNDVKQTGHRVEFGLKVAHGSFEGTLSTAGTELSGNLTHEGAGIPLTLRKK
jgi:hypothetical protein